MARNLYDANRQWATRPDDERFSSLSEMLDACKGFAASATTAIVPTSSLRVEVGDRDNLALTAGDSKGAIIGNYAFGQLARLAKAPADYLTRLPAKLAADNLNSGLVQDSTDRVNVLFHNSGRLARAITTDSYDRVWDHEVIEKVAMRLADQGWVVPPARPARSGQAGTRPATEADILPNQGDFGLAVKVGDPIAPAGLYASDHDMFAFLVNHADPVWDGAKFLNRGLFASNSEVGDGGLSLTVFTYDNVCGNHIVWGVSKCAKVSVRHRKSDKLSSGQTLNRLISQWAVTLSEIPTASVISEQIQAAKTHEIAASKDQVLEALVKFAKVKGLSKLSSKVLSAGYEIAASTPRYGAPTTVWGMVNGLTEYSQTTGFADERATFDAQAGRLMEIAVN